LDYLTTPDVLTDDVPDLAIGLMLVVLRKLLRTLMVKVILKS
jgi:lactate dehydrogenase-like 2-hydroxyacid dehydrogenase